MYELVYDWEVRKRMVVEVLQVRKLQMFGRSLTLSENLKLGLWRRGKVQGVRTQFALPGRTCDIQLFNLLFPRENQ